MSEEEPSFPLNTDTYQTPKTAVVVLYTRNHTVENLVTHPEEQSLTIEADIDGQHCVKAWSFFGPVKPDSIRVDKGGIKIEIIFMKVQAINWPHCEAKDTNLKPLYEKWRHTEITEEEDKAEGFENFIQKMYRDADPDAKRAMIKSMIESKGTVLSGDWNDVGSRTVEPQPPK